MDEVQKSAVKYDFFGQCLADEEIAPQLVGREDHFGEAFRQPVFLPFFIIQTNQFTFLKHFDHPLMHTIGGRFGKPQGS